MTNKRLVFIGLGAAAVGGAFYIYRHRAADGGPETFPTAVFAGTDTGGVNLGSWGVNNVAGADPSSGWITRPGDAIGTHGGGTRYFPPTRFKPPGGVPGPVKNPTLPTGGLRK